MKKEGICKGAGFFVIVLVLIVVIILISIPVWWATIHQINQHLDLAIRMIPKEAVGVAGMVEAQFMLVRQEVWFLFFFGLAGWSLFLWHLGFSDDHK